MQIYVIIDFCNANLFSKWFLLISFLTNLNVSWWSVPYNMCTYRRTVILIVWRERYSWTCFHTSVNHVFWERARALVFNRTSFYHLAPFRFYVSDCIFYFIKVSSIFFKSMQLIFIFRKKSNICIVIRVYKKIKINMRKIMKFKELWIMKQIIIIILAIEILYYN